jgi:hypothetical protein
MKRRITLLSSRPNSGTQYRWLLAGGMMLLAMAIAGCGYRTETATESPLLTECDLVLRRMIDTYRHARTYADSGIVRLRYRADGQWVEDQGRFAVRLQRPNRLIVRAYQLTIACDGDQWVVHIDDPQTGDLDGQVLVRPAPEQLTLDDVYLDPLSKDVMVGGMGGPPLTLELLLSDNPLEHLFDGAARRELLSDQPIASRMCRRVRVTLDEGTLVFWIERETNLLRRLEYPTERLASQLDPDGLLENLSLVAEFRESCVDIDLGADSFALSFPPDAKLVSRFVLPPRPLPSDVLGRVPEAFYFVGLDFDTWTQDALLGQTAVLVWFNIHPASEACLRQLAEIRRGMAEDEPITFLAVCTEPTTIGNRQLDRLAEDWGLTMRIVRDLEAFGRDVFQIPGAPTVVVLDPRGVVQAFQVGANPKLSETLPHVLQQIGSGQDLAEAMVGQFQQQQETYHRALLEVMHPSPPRDATRQRSVY